MAQKLTARDLKRDLQHDKVGEAVAGASGVAYRAVSSHKTIVFGLIGAALVLALGLSIWQHSKQKSEREAQAALATAMADVDALRDGSAATDTLAPGKTPPTWDSVHSTLTTVAREHPRTAAGKVARFQAAIVDLERGQATSAAAELKAVADADDSSWITPHALAALAGAREQAGDVPGAEEALGKLRDGSWSSYPPAAAKQLLAALYERTDRPAEARTIYAALAEDESLKESSYASTARTKLEELGQR